MFRLHLHRPMAIMITTLVCVFMLCFSYTNGSNATIKDINSLKARLMDGYNKYTNPCLDDFVKVTVAVMINAIGDLDEQSERLATDMELLIMWTDESMIWNGSETGIYSINMNPSAMWVPEIFVYNRHYDISIGTLHRRFMPIEYYNTGFAMFTQFITTQTTCDLNTSKFPFDRHTCSIELQVNKWKVLVEPEFQSFILHNFQPDGSWDVTNATIEGKNRSIHIHITFVRKPGFILLNLILPLTVLALLSPMVFLLPNHSGERVAFSVTNLLAISVYMTIISDYVPQKSNPMPLISIMLFISYSLTGLVIMVVIINARIYRLPETVKIPRVLIYLITVSECMCVCFKRRNKNVQESGIFNETESKLECPCALLKRKIMDAQVDKNKEESEPKLGCLCILLKRNKVSQDEGTDGKKEPGLRCPCTLMSRNKVVTDESIHDDTESRQGEPIPDNLSPTYKHSWKDVSWSIDMFFMTIIYILKLSILFIFIAVLNS